MKTDKEFEDFFRNRLEDFGTEPPEESWKNIQRDITKPGRANLIQVSLAMLCIFLAVIPSSVTEKNVAVFQSSHPVTHPQTANNMPVEKEKKKKNFPHEKITASEQDKNQLSEHRVRDSLQLHPHKNALLPDSKVTSVQSEEIEDKVNTPPAEITSEKTTAHTPGNKLTAGKITYPVEPHTEQKNALTYSTKKSINRKRETNLYIGKPAPVIAPTGKSIRENTLEKLPAEGIKSAGDNEKYTGKAKKTSAANPTNNTNKALVTIEKAEINTMPGGILESGEKTVSEPLAAQKEVHTPGIPVAKDSISVRADTLLTLPATPETDIPKQQIVPLKYLSAYTLKLYFSPHYAYRRFAPNRNDEILVDKIYLNGGRLHERLGYEAGIGIGKQLGKRFAAQANLHVMRLKETAQLTTTSAVIDSVQISQVQNNNEFTVDPLLKRVHRQYRSTYQYAGLNANLSYQYAGNNRHRLYITMGGGVNLLVKGKTLIYQDSFYKEIIEFPSPGNPFEQMNYRLSFSPGYAFRMHEKVQITIEPVLHYFLGSTYKKREPVGVKPYTIGISAGILFNRGEKQIYKK